MIGTLILAAAVSTMPLRLSPAKPTVGDVIRVDLRGVSGKIGVVPSPCVEVVSVGSSDFRIRSFRPGKCDVRYSVGADRFVVPIEIHSVLAAGDETLAPLRPPVDLPPDRTARIALAAAALFALLAWGALFFRSRRRQRVGAAAVALRDPFEEFSEAIVAFAGGEDRTSAAGLADALRRFLARVDSRFSPDLTSRELTGEMRGAGLDARTVAAVRSILSRGDVAKFSATAPLPAVEAEGASRVMESFRPPMEKAS
jgi:hypothetical protein